MTTTLNDVGRLPIRPLEARGIGQEVVALYDVRSEVDQQTGGEAAYYFPLYKNGELTGYQRKVARRPGEREKGDIQRVGESKGCDPFGSRAAGSHGALVIVTEGAEDCLAAAELFRRSGKKYRVVSTLGTDGWKRTLSYFQGFEKVAICYDQDEAGRRAAAEFASALGGGKAIIMRWDGAAEDPNALLVLYKDAAERIMDALKNARPHTPDGIITGEEVWQRMESYVEPAYIPYPDDWATLQSKVGGIREGEITMFTGGSSVGKTVYARRIKHHILANTDWAIGEVELEERGEKTWRGLMEQELQQAWKHASIEDRRAAYEATYGTKRIFTLDHRSQYGRGQSLVTKFKHLHHGHGCRALFLDHITLAVSEFGDGNGNIAQDQMMNEFLEFVESTGCHLFLISHLRKTGVGGKSFEEGAVPSMDDLKGSGSLKQISFNIIGVSRNLQHEDEYERNVSQLHILKCRETGRTGRADRLYWDDATKSLLPAREPPGGEQPPEPAVESEEEREF